MGIIMAKQTPAAEESATDRVVEGAQAVTKEVTDGVTDLTSAVLDYQISLGDFSFTVGNLLAGLITLALLWFIALRVRHGFDRYAQRREVSRRASLYTLSRVIYYVLVAISFTIAMSVAGVPISKFAVFAGALGVGLGFGLQAIFSNFISGLILLFDRSLKVGDFVELESGVVGEVRDINIRSTRITTNDYIDILVPNSEFVTGRVNNWTYGSKYRRLRIAFGVAYGSDKELVKKAALEAAEAVPFTMAMDGARGPQVWLLEFGDSSLNFELVVWIDSEATKRPLAVTAAYNWELETTLGRYGIEIPFPQSDLNVRSLFGLNAEEALRFISEPEYRKALQREASKRKHAEDRPELSAEERAALSQNDAVCDVELQLEAEKHNTSHGRDDEDDDGVDTEQSEGEQAHDASHPPHQEPPSNQPKEPTP